MLADLSIIPVGGNTHTSGVLAEVLELIDASGIEYQLTPTTTCLEGHGMKSPASPNAATSWRAATIHMS